MSILVSRTLYLNPHQSQQYAANSSSNINWTYTIVLDGSRRQVAVNASLKANASVSFNLNSTAMDILYPSSSAKPTKATISMSGCRSISLLGAKAEVMLYFNGDSVYDESFDSQFTETVEREDLTNASITGSRRDSTIKVELKRLTGLNSVNVNIVSGYITLLFKQCFFSAFGENCSAQVSSTSAYDGETVTYTCTLDSGKVFAGWYNGKELISTSQTYVHTVNGSDLRLTAKTVSPSATASATYDGRTLFTVSNISGVLTAQYDGQTIVALSSGYYTTLTCAGKLMKTDITVAGKTLLCAGKVMATDVVLNYYGG